jgi:hypothetical protein
VYCNIRERESEEHRRKESRELCEDTHVQRFELIEKALTQIHGTGFVLCVCILNVMLMVLLFLSYNCFYAMYE